jgi:DNA-binding transcriptional MerR regulator
MIYTTEDLHLFFHVAPQTIRNWTHEFARYFSESATPKSGRNRRYDDLDLQVLNLIYALRRDHQSYQVIHAALESGERGTDAGLSGTEMKQGESARRLALEVQILRQQLARAEERFRELEALRESTIRLEVEKEAETQRKNTLRIQLSEFAEKVEQVLPEVARAYHAGYVDALKRPTSTSE